MAWQSLPAALMAAVVFYLGAYHLFIYLRRPQEKRELSFALLCFAFGAFDIFAAALYSSPSVAEGVVWQKWQSVALGASGAALLWFIAEYMHLTPRKLIVTGASLYLLLGIIALISPDGLVWSSTPMEKHIRLLFGVEYTYYETAPGPVAYAMMVLGVVSLAYAFWLTLRFFASGERRKAIPLLVFFVIVLIGVFNDTLVATGVYTSLYLMKYCFFALVLLMADALSLELVEAAKTEKALKAREKLFRVLVENHPESIYRFDRERRYLYANPAVGLLTGIPTTELVGKTIEELGWPEDECAYWRAQGDAIFSSGEPQKGVAKINANGEYKYLAWHMVPEYNDQGEITSVLCSERDITELREVEEEVRRHHSLIHSIAEASPVGITVVDAAGQITFANAQAEQVLGLTKDEIIARKYNSPEWKITDYEGQSFADEDLPFARVVQTREPVFGIQHAIERPEGDRRLLSINSAPLFDQAGELEGMVATIEDVTNQYQAEQRLAESEKRYRSLMEQLQVAIAVGTPDSLAYVNPAFCKLLGYDNQEEVLGMAPGELVAPEYREIALKQTNTQLKDATPSQLPEIKLQHKAGSEVWVEVSTDVHEYEGQPTLVATLHDITQRKQAEEALKASEERFRALTENAADVIDIIDAQGRPIYASPSHERVVGYSPDELVGKNTLDYLHSDDQQMAQDLLSRLIAAPGTTEQAELRFQHQDGTWRVLEATAKNMFDVPSVNGLVVNFRDITERKRAEELNTKQRELLHRLNFVRTLDEALQLCLAAALDMCQAAGGGVYLVDRDSGAVDLKHHRGLPEVFTSKVSHYDAKSPNTALVMQGLPVYLPFEALADLLVDVPEADKIKMLAVIPISFENRVIGCINVASREEHGFSAHDQVALETVSEQIGSVIARLEAEEALLNAEQEKALILSSVSENVTFQDKDLLIRWANRAAAESAGLSIVELIGTRCYEIWGERQNPCPDCPVLVALQTGKEQSIEKQTPDGRWWHVRGYPARDDSGRVIGAVEVTAEVTARKHAQDALKRSEERYRTLIETMQDGLVAQDTGMRITYVNDRLCQMLGYKPEELLGKHTSTIVSELHHDVLNAEFQKRKTGAFGSYELVLLAKAGRELITTISPASIWDDGEFAGSFAVVTDITDRKQAQRELERYRDHLEELVIERTQKLETAQQELLRNERLATLGQLTAMVSHEIRNPLGTVRTSVFSIGDALERNDTPRIERALRLAERNIVRCDNIIEELLAFTRTRELDLKRTDIDSWLQSTLSELTAPPEIESYYVLNSGVEAEVDREQLRRAIVNIFENAVQALMDKQSPGKKLTVSTLLADSRITITFADNGPGIPAEVLPKVFEPLFSTKSFGIGLGMPIVKNIIEQHGGEVSVHTNPGKGTTVVLKLPLKQNERQGG